MPPDPNMDESETLHTRILFGDKEAYLNKFKTRVRARPVELQALSTSFDKREHTKQLFKLKNILCMYIVQSVHQL